MKSSKKITRIRLEESQPDDYIFMGLVSSDPDYKLSLLLNSRFRISLKHAEPVKVSGEASGNDFSRFTTNAGPTGLAFYLVSNRSGKDYLLKKLKNIDYIFVSHDPEKEIDTETLASDLRQVESVTAVFKIDPDNLKDKNIQYLIH